MRFVNYFAFLDSEAQVSNAEYQAYISTLKDLSQKAVAAIPSKSKAQVLVAVEDLKNHYKTRMLDTLVRESVMFFLIDLAKEINPEVRDENWIYSAFKNF